MPNVRDEAEPNDTGLMHELLTMYPGQKMKEDELTVLRQIQRCRELGIDPECLKAAIMDFSSASHNQGCFESAADFFGDSPIFVLYGNFPMDKWNAAEQIKIRRCEAQKHGNAESREALDPPETFDSREALGTTQTPENHPGSLRDANLFSAEVTRDEGPGQEEDVLSPADFFERHWKLPLKQFFSLAYDYAVECHTDRQVDPAQAEENGRFRTPMFELVYLFKGHPHLDGVDAPDAWKMVNHLAPAAWEDAFGFTADDAEAEFYHLWDAIWSTPGQSMIANAIARARQNPIRIPFEIRRKRPKRYPEFLAVAAHLQRMVGDRNFILDPRASDWVDFGINHVTVWRYCHHAMEDGFLTLKVKGSRPKGKRKGIASEFRFNVAMAPYLFAA
jgi:hypothetical protein